jgi:chromosome partition protein MukB
VRRARAATLVLVNWKGVFYERYLLDEHVTALEGDNGAGKTTVIVAAYVVMLPDMTRLRFTNVGEGDATGGDRGVWGRLGNPNRPSYAALELDLGGERLMAGVRLERRGEPSVELTPFLITDLPEGTRHQEVLLIRSDEEDLVPEMADLRDNVGRLGGRIQVFRTAKEYFAALFERGVTPLRLALDDERTRFNDMLRTSMTGGLSRALTTEFRSFLLKEESGLADTLVRMRANLDACRRTRTEVNEARALEGEISGVYEAGHEMFATALLAARERAAELRRRVEEATSRRDAAVRARDDVNRELGRSEVERGDVEARLGRARPELDDAKERHTRTVRANAVAQRIDALDRQLADLGDRLRERTSAMDAARDLADRRVAERKRAEDAYRSAAQGLAESQRGLDELHRRAAAHRAVTWNLDQARSELEMPDVGPGEVDEQERNVERALGEVDARRQELDGGVALAEARRVDHDRALAALAALVDGEPDPCTAHEAARAALRRLSDLEALAGRAEALSEELERVRASSERQRATRAVAAALAREGQELGTSSAVREAFARAEANLRAHEERARSDLHVVEECRRARASLHDREQALLERSARWRELELVASRLDRVVGIERRTAPALESARKVLDDERDDAQCRHTALHAERDALHSRARSLERTGGLFHEDLLAARDIVGGELLAGHFDDVDPGEAGRIQARLGPLADAIIVEDGRDAARMLAGQPRELGTVWFVEGGGLHHVIGPEGRASDGEVETEDVTVGGDGVVRTTRVPAHPTLGRRARQRLVAELRSRADELRAQLADVDDRLAEIEGCRRDIALLTREVATLERGDPATELDGVRTELGALAARLEEHRVAAEHAERLADAASARKEALGELLIESFLLDQPDLSARLVELEAEAKAAQRTRVELGRLAEPRSILVDDLDVLRRPPPTGDEIDAMRSELEALGTRRGRLFRAREALHHVATHREALGWSDADDALSAKRELMPALELQCAQAERARDDATAAAEAAENAWEETRRARREIDDRRNATQESRVREWQDLAELGVEDPSPSGVDRSRAEVEQLELHVHELDLRERELAKSVARLEERLRGCEDDLTSARQHLDKEERERKPAEELWQRLRSKSEERGLLTPAVTTRLLGSGAGSVNLWPEAQRWRTALEERLAGARDGSDVLVDIRSSMSAQDQTTADDYLRVWETIRDWIRRRVPAQITEVDDPLEALQRLKRHLAALGERLEGQEAALRGASEDVARGIDVHLRSAHRQVRALNRELEGVGFGTIGAMRIRLARDDRMDGVLNALRRGSAQELLFAPAMPIEEALDELFSRFGGRGQTLGRRLLDYREYVETVVEVRRTTSPEWERVNPSRLSTGEAIGVGTALMMVVLTAWEGSANLFRARRSLGTLRLLFLDEANRLSQDNLDVLFELCGVLDLQLLIASPEVARGPGCTTYRLVRRPTADGGEEVLVSGRRAVARDEPNVGT